MHVKRDTQTCNHFDNATAPPPVTVHILFERERREAVMPTSTSNRFETIQTSRANL